MLQPAHRRATAGGVDLDLTRIEYALLAALARQPGTLLPYCELAHRVWHCGDASLVNSIHSHVSRIRRKLAMAAPAGEARPAIESVYGVGYRLIPDRRERVRRSDLVDAPEAAAAPS